MTGAKRPRTAQILRGRVETRVYYQASYGPLVSCVIEGVTEGHWRSMAITTGAKRRVFVTNRGIRAVLGRYAPGMAAVGPNHK